MPRNGSGTASVVNSFVPLTIADANAVNENFTDIASMLTGSLPRDGQAGMTGQLQVLPGSSANPGVAFTTDTDTGVRRSGANEFTIVCGGVDIATFSSAGFSLLTGAIAGAGSVIPGEIKMWPGPTAPTGYRICDGTALLIATYPTMAANIYVGNTLNATALWGYRCTNPADATNTRSTAGTYIVVPDLRGEFVRGLDNGRGIDAARALASLQAQAIQTHNHSVNDPGHFHNWGNTAQAQGLAVGTTGSFSQGGTPPGELNTASATTGISIGSTGSAETRPRNVSINYIIKL